MWPDDCQPDRLPSPETKHVCVRVSARAKCLVPIRFIQIDLQAPCPMVHPGQRNKRPSLISLHQLRTLSGTRPCFELGVPDRNLLACWLAGLLPTASSISNPSYPRPRSSAESRIDLTLQIRPIAVYALPSRAATKRISGLCCWSITFGAFAAISEALQPACCCHSPTPAAHLWFICPVRKSASGAREWVRSLRR